VQNCLWIIWLGNKLAETHNIAALLYEVLEVVIAAFVCQLSHLDALRSKLFVKVKEV
jgi:hypothetical protein